MAARLTAYAVVAIVAATLIAGLIVGAQRDENEGPIDLIVRNAVVYTAIADGEMAEAVAVRGNQILRVGREREIMRLQRPQTTVIDARGAAVLPGFNDAHVHFVGGGIALDRIDLLNATTIAEIRQRIAAWAAANPDRPWVLGRGWYYQPFPDGLPTRQLLDEIVADRPAHLVAYDGHTAWVNSKALALAGITKRTADPRNGIIVKDPRTGEPTGVLKEAAMSLVGRLVPEPTGEDRERALRAAMVEAHRNGITSVQNASGSPEEFSLYADLRRAGELDLRVYSALSVKGVMSDAEIDEIEKVRREYPDDPLFKTGAVKAMLDGVIEAHTAAMLEPYANASSSGTPTVGVDEFNRTVRLLDARGWQVMTHAIGDRAVRMALDAYAHAARSNPVPARGRRHRIEHLETVAAIDLPRFGALGVIASMQPYHGTPTPSQIDVWSRNVGPERASRGWPYRSIVAGRGRLAFGSDWPVVGLNPLLGIHTAVTRTAVDGQPERGWHPEQRITLEAAIRAYTSDAAWASFDEQRKGTLEPGMLADLVILSRDIFSAPPHLLASTTVEATIFDGKIVYQRVRPLTD
ncbi:MAG TPA: amidohydrolase [Vicinamibacterales bacterium]|nr:amidohydrolase [Vicinamibacterales bacterium]